MLRLVAAPVASLAISVPLGFKVYAAESEATPKTDPAPKVDPAPKPDQPASPQPSKCKPSQLPIYRDPPKVEYAFFPDEETTYTKGVTSFRKSLWNLMDATHETTDKIKDKLGVAQAHSSDLLRYIQEDAGIVPKAIIITVAGLGGIVAGYRGRYVKKGVYATIGMVTAASICYPHQAVDITQYGWSRFKRDVLGMKHTVVETMEKTEQIGKDKATTDTATSKSSTAKEVGYDQSKLEDKDMYTTRGS